MTWTTRLVCLIVVVSELKAVRGDDTIDPQPEPQPQPQPQYTVAEARIFIAQLDKECSVWGNKLAIAEWDYNSNLTDYNLQRQLKLQSEFAEYYKKQWNEVIKYPWKTFQDESLKRQFKFYSVLGSAALPEEKRNRLDEVVATMQDVYSKTKLLEYKEPEERTKTNHSEPTIPLEPDLYSFFADNSEDDCKLLYYWEGWHGSVGRKEKPLFLEYVDLSNEAARLNNYTDLSAAWNDDDFEMENFDEAMHKLYLQILPFYQQLHAYVRRRLIKHHNTKDRRLIEQGGSLPVHLMGNMWGQSWNNVYDLTAPFPKKTSVDVTPAMQAKNFTALQMFKMSEEFYTSLNLSAMTETFWEKSIIEKPTDREIVCHASAWDLDDGDDYRIKMCTKINLEDFKTVHHEMGHIQYYMQYKDQPRVFRAGANSGFHEAVGDTISLSVSTAEHLIEVGLLDADTYEASRKADINSLYLMALEKVAFLPFAYVLDLWRWEIFRGNVTADQYNCRYWQLRQELQGIVPPIDRSAKEFDPGAKYHVIADVPYIRYFVSFIIQFQWYKALCIKAGQYNPDDPTSKPLHHCDIYKSKEAGNLFGKMLQMGKSKPPEEAMEVITGQKDMDAGPLLEYFKPLHDWLVHENQRTETTIGWTHESKVTCRTNGRVKTSQDVDSIDPKCRYYRSRRKGSKKQNGNPNKNQNEKKNDDQNESVESKES